MEMLQVFDGNESPVSNRLEDAQEFEPLPQVDPGWYLETYPDVSRVPMDAETHYRLYGCRLGRDPTPDFSTVFFQSLLKLSSRKNPLRELARSSRGGVVPKSAANPGRMLWASAELARRGQIERAIALADQWLPSVYRYRANILRANLAVEQGDSTAWLRAANAYLEHFGVAPIHLTGDGTLFDRINASSPETIASGPKVSIIVAAWNSERTIEKAIRSLLAQSWRNLELLVVDDCSSDGTWGVISRIVEGDNRVKAWRNSENVGPYVSRNIAAAYASGDWITCHDADDWAHPERIARQVQFCLENRYSACLSGMLRVSEHGEFTRLSRAGGFVHDGACRSGLVSLFMSAQLFLDLLGSWDQVRAGGDSELLSRLETVTRKKVRQLRVPTMLCRDHEESLTNDARFGQQVELDDGVRTRVRYRDSYLAAHESLNKRTSRYEFPTQSPRFEANELQVPWASVQRVAEPHQAQLEQDVIADVVIITTARFPGGNASSTLDELRYFTSMGVDVALVHCPVEPSMGRELSERYASFRSIVHHWSRVRSIKAPVLICRGPRVLTSHAFRHLTPRIHADNVFIVKNNSRMRPDGTTAYEIDEMVRAAQDLGTGRLEFCPISQLMRSELIEYSRLSGNRLRLSSLDWTPTFDPSLYLHPPKPLMHPPYRIGRHARDGVEKWREDPAELLMAYPPDGDFEVRILGGADQAQLILGALPENWQVSAFGEIEPREFLENLDAFVYFPASQLVEGFGRTIVEAMIAGVPVIVPPSLESTFGELVLACDPIDVRGIIERLAADTHGRVAYLEDVQRIALARYGAEVIATRLQGCGVNLPARHDNVQEAGLSADSRLFRSSVLQR